MIQIQMITTPIKQKTLTNTKTTTDLNVLNKTTINLSLSGHLPSQIEGLFKNKNEKIKEKEPTLEDRPFL